MYEDERRREEILKQQQLAAFVADPEKLKVKYEGLVARDDRYKKQVKELQNELRVAKSKATSSQQQVKQLSDQLATSQANLARSSREIARLKDTLINLRASRTMKVGRTVLAPLKVFRPFKKADATKTTSAQSKEIAAKVAPVTPATEKPTSQPTPKPASKVTAESKPKEVKAGTKPAGAPNKKATEVASGVAKSKPVEKVKSMIRKISDYSYEELIELFEKNPNHTNLGYVITRAWYDVGDITGPLKYVSQYPELERKLSEKSQVILGRIRGMQRALENFSLCDRGQHPAYLPERNRVLYIAHHTPVTTSNGYAIRTRGVVEGLVKQGLDVVVMARPGNPWDGGESAQFPTKARTVKRLGGIDYVFVPGPKLDITPEDEYFQSAADAIVREARLSRPSLIHSASNYLSAIPALIAARRLGIPFVYEVRGLWEESVIARKPLMAGSDLYQIQVELESLACQEADLVLAITEQVASELRRRGVSNPNIVVAPNGVDPDALMPLPQDDAYRVAKGLPKETPIIGFAGSMVEYEGLDYLLDATRILADRGLKFHVALAGSGVVSESLKTRIAELNLGKYVTHLGRVPNTEMPRLMSQFDIMPCPRRSLSVTELVSPLKPLESFSAAKAVLLSDVKPHQDIAGANQERALLFKAGDVQDLADKLQLLIEDEDLRRRLGRTGRLWVLDKRNWDNITAQIARSYDLARQAYAKQVQTSNIRQLSDLKVAIIADEFTSTTLAATFDCVPLSRTQYANQFEEHDFDFFFLESAWEGNEGQWHRGIGNYSEQEDADLAAVLKLCNEKNIPTVFWNKEDPVHFKRFIPAARRCDYVFTTDASLITDYLRRGLGTTKTVSGLSFYAQPAIHNPLAGTRGFENTVSYAGTYYGNRYADRSAELLKILKVADKYGLAIYDRQYNNPDSPYKFPAELKDSIRGSLPYQEVIDAYKSHAVSLNVNSVANSPSMFSRRVVEVAACGGVLCSGPGRAIPETFGDAIFVGKDVASWEAALLDWTTNPNSRLIEAWRQMRAVYRSHTVHTAMTLLARIIGFNVPGFTLPNYALVNENATLSWAKQLLKQSVLPQKVFLVAQAGSGFGEIQDLLSGAGIEIEVIENLDAHFPQQSLQAAGVQWISSETQILNRTQFEDRLLATLYGDWDGIGVEELPVDDLGVPIARLSDDVNQESRLLRLAAIGEVETFAELSATVVSGLNLIVPRRRAATFKKLLGVQKANAELIPNVAGKRILVAGHDLKFAQDLITGLQAAGATVLIDQWQGHAIHDAEKSMDLLTQADIIWCEWGLGNLKWYSNHVKPGQKIITRIHLQEITLPFLSQTKHENVTKYVFVGELIRQSVISTYGIPAENTVVIPNYVDPSIVGLEKLPGHEKNLGLVGILPQRKRIDLALDLLENLLEQDPEYRLFVKGKQPQEIPWMKKRPDELAYFDAQYERVEKINAKYPGAVVFEAFTPDMGEWYQKIGVVISVSDFESFHLTLADGAATGALPVTLAWDGVDYIYPRHWISVTCSELADRIREINADPDREIKIAEYRDFATSQFNFERVYKQFASLL